MYRLILSVTVTLLVISTIPCYCQGTIVSEVATYKQPLELHCSEAKDAVTWYKDDVPLVEDKLYKINKDNNTMRILSVEPKALGAFACKYNNSGSQTVFHISVRAFVTQFDKPRNVIQGDPLRLDCKAWGIPALKITWYHGDVELAPSDSGKIKFKDFVGEKEGFPQIENGTIRIEEMEDNDAGNYSCRAVNRINGEDVKAEAIIAVQVKDKYAALWPFLGICIEVAVLCTIILLYERRRAKRIEQEESREEAERLNVNNDARPGVGGEEVRQRK